jgi:hypothetical protein
MCCKLGAKYEKNNAPTVGRKRGTVRCKRQRKIRTWWPLPLTINLHNRLFVLAIEREREREREMSVVCQLYTKSW